MIHRFWMGEPHPMAGFTRQAITSLMREPVEWDIDKVSSLLEGIIGKRKLDALLAEEDRRHISNVVRYSVLYKFGGLWLDHDVLPLRDLRYSSAYTAGFAQPIYSREGCVMWFPEPRHPMLWDLISAAAADQPHTKSVDRSGANQLTSIGFYHPEVRVEPHVLPFDSTGRWMHRRDPAAVHLWDSSHAAR